MAKSPTVPQPKPTSGNEPQKPAERTVAHRVFVHVSTTGKRASLTTIGLHEFPLIRKKLQAFGESAQLVAEWPKGTPRVREVTFSDIEMMQNRLMEQYVFSPPDSDAVVDLVTDFYGPFQNGANLIRVMNTIHREWKKLEEHCIKEEREPDEDEILQVLSSVDGQAMEMIELDSPTIDANA